MSEFLNIPDNSIYIIGFNEFGLVKIGRSTNPKHRILKIAYELGSEANNIYISDPLETSFFIEKKCHEMLYPLLFGGFGESGIHKKELFKYSFKKAKWILLNLLNSEKLRLFYNDSFWENASCRHTLRPGMPGTEKYIKITSLLIGAGKLVKVRQYSGPGGETKRTIEFEVEI